jgi:hypothetical protein
MKLVHLYQDHWIELQGERLPDDTWSYRVKIDGDWINQDDDEAAQGFSGTNELEAYQKALDAARETIRITERLEGRRIG